MLHSNKLQTKYKWLSVQKMTKTGKSMALMGALMFCLALSSVQQTKAEAISEVWSEGDGLKMKYSTHHDDLLGVKGSELSLSTDRNQVAHHEQAAGAAEGAGQEESTSSGSSANSDQEGDSAPASEEQSSSSSSGAQDTSEQGADSSSRQVEKIPLAGRVQSYSSVASNQHLLATKQPRPASKSHQRGRHEDDDEAIPPPAPMGRLHSASLRSSSSSGAAKTSSAASNQVNQESPLSFDSALEQSERPEEGDSTVNVDRGQADSDSSAGDSTDHSNTLNARFRQPSRLFKEAVRMNTNNDADDDDQRHQSKPAASTSAVDESGEGNDSSSSSDENSNSQEATRSSGGGGGGDEQESNNENGEAAAAAPPEATAGDDEGTFQGSQQRQQQQPKRQPNMMIDHAFDGPTRPTSATAVEDDDELNKRRSGPSAPSLGANFNRKSTPASGDYSPAPLDDDEAPANFFRANAASGQFFDHSGQSRAALATGHKERVQPISGATPKKPTAPASPSPKQPYKQLAYFRGVAEQHQQFQQQQQQLAGAAPRSRPVSSSFRASGSFDGPPDSSSPDSVRDNFISPGHFPGSMPHLTQAASEVKSDAADTSKVDTGSTATAAAATPPAQVNLSPSASSSQLVASDSNTDYKNVPSPVVDEKANAKADQRAAPSEPEPQQQQANEIVQVVSTVTPEPDSQSDSLNQIMAPILMSTTTMAPMQPTSAAPSASSPTTSTTSSTTTTTSTSTTTAPSLKRFKFRKYR